MRGEVSNGKEKKIKATKRLKPMSDCDRLAAKWQQPPAQVLIYPQRPQHHLPSSILITCTQYKMFKTSHLTSASDQHVPPCPLFSCLSSDRTCAEKGTAVLDAPTTDFIGKTQGNAEHIHAREKSFVFRGKLRPRKRERFGLRDNNTALFKLLNT